MLLGEDPRHRVAVFDADARHGRQVSHGDLRGNASFADLLLDGLRQCVHQRQTACDPGGTAIEAARQVFDGVAILVFHLGQQPALFERGLRLTVAAQGMHQQQGFGFACCVQNESIDRVATQLLERGDALVSIDHQIALLHLDNEDGGLLAGFSQRSQELSETRRVADPEVRQTAVQLMKLQGLLRHGIQYAAGAEGSLAARRGCWSEPVSDQ